MATLSNEELWKSIASAFIVRYHERVFREHFGVSVKHVIEIWHHIASRNIQPVHLLWTLYFLKVYPTESVAAATLNTSPKTYRKVVREVIGLMNRRLPKVTYTLVL